MPAPQMTARRRSTAVAAVSLAIVTAVVYGLGLDRLYLVHDEVVYALNAYSIATTWRDLSGHFLPVSIPVVGTFFATPMNIYFTALFLKLAPVSEITIRLPSVVIGVINVVLVFLVARRIFRSEGLAMVAAAVLALTPAHFVHSRLGTDHNYTVALMLAWLLCLLGVEREGQVKRIAGATACLGLGIYSYLGAAVTMPVCFALTCLSLWQLGFRSKAPYLAAIAGFVVPMVPFLLWHLMHPDQYARQMQMYGLYDPQHVGPAAGARQLIGLASIAERVAVFWDYFNPSFLFFAGDTGLINGTRDAGVFLWPMMVLLPVGLGRLITARLTAANLLLVGGLLASPLAATVVAERYRINRALVMLPLAALVATAGVEALWTARRRAWRVVAVLLLAAMPLQFTLFYRDYFIGYPVRSYTWFEYNIRGGMEEIIAREAAKAEPVFIGQNIQWAEYYWPIYLAKHGRRDLQPRTTYVDFQAAATVPSIPAGSFVLCRISDAGLFSRAGFQLVSEISEPDGSKSFSVFQR